MVMKIDKLYFIAKCVLINNENKFLILKRTNYKNDGNEGLWDIPGGSVNLDEDVNLAVKREVEEELQIKISNIKPISIDSGKGIPTGQFIFVLFCSYDYNSKDKIILSNEHSEYKWISVNEINNYNYYLGQERIENIKNYLENSK